MKDFINKHLSILLFVATLLFVALVYHDSFTSAFFQDDKLHLTVMNQGQLWEPIKGFPYYRPISIKIFYSLGFLIGGYNTLPYHLILFACFAVSVFTIQKLAKLLLNNDSQANISMVFFALNVSLFGIFYLLAGSYVVFGSMFILLALWFYIKRGTLNLLVSTIFTILALGSSELAYVLPGLMAITDWFNGKIQKLRLIFFAGLIGLAFILRKLTLSFPNNADYDMHFDLSVISNIKWYFFRVLNLPEGVQRYHSQVFWIVSILFFVLLIYGIFRYFTSGKVNLKLILFSIMWFVIAGAPYYLMSKHMSSIYIMLAFFGPATFLSEIFKTKKLVVAVIVLYMLMTILGLEFLRESHWMILKNTGPIGQFTTL